MWFVGRWVLCGKVVILSPRNRYADSPGPRWAKVSPKHVQEIKSFCEHIICQMPKELDKKSWAQKSKKCLRMEGAILIWTEVMVQPSGRLEESDVSVGGLHFGLLFLCLLQLVSNLYTVLYQASICCKNSQQLTKSAGLCQNEKGEREIAQIQWLAQIWAIRQGHTAAWCNEAKLQKMNVQPSKATQNIKY